MSINDRTLRITTCFLIVAATILLPILDAQTASAAQISARSLTLEAGATDGGSKPGGLVKHFYQFTIPTTADVGSIKFLYCTTAGSTCTTPTGLVTTSATLDDQSGATGFTVDNTINGAPYITRTAASIASSTPVTYRFGNVTNPTNTNEAFYVRITTYLSTDTTGGSTDYGVVAASTSTQITLSGTMPESLIFCTGATISTTGGIPDCSTATAGTVSFNQLFSPTDTATATSKMAASTNAGAGYAISVNGPTLTSGSNTISAMGVAGVGLRGISQFGMNLKANTAATSTVPIGTEVTPAAGAGGGTFKGQAVGGYSTVDQFKFLSGDTVADSAFGGANGSDAQIFTTSYIVNVSGSQAAGTYTSTLTYICTPTF